jgi:hypothetical protein
MPRIARIVVAFALAVAGLTLARPAGAVSSTPVFMLGDSVMASFHFSTSDDTLINAEYPNTTLDAEECRGLFVSCRLPWQPSAPSPALNVLQANRGKLTGVLVMGVGYNEVVTGTAIDTIMTELTTHDSPRVIWLNYRNYSGRYTSANAALVAAVSRWPQLSIGDWNAYSAGHGSDWFATDGTDVHLTGAGATAHATLIRSLLDASAKKYGCPSNNTAGPATAAARGYWLLDSTGKVWPYSAPSFGDLTTIGVTAKPASFQSTPTGAGYWILDQSGGVHAFGDATAWGDMTGKLLNGPVRRIEPNPAGGGYWLVAADGGVFTFGPTTGFQGSMGATRLNAPVISMAATVTGRGYWLVAGDGGVFTFGDGQFHGSAGAMTLNAPVISMAVRPNGAGYWLYAKDGGVFSFDVPFFGSEPRLPECGDQAVALRVTNTGGGYWLASRTGKVFAFGDAPMFGDQPVLPVGVTIIDLAVRH